MTSERKRDCALKIVEHPVARFNFFSSTPQITADLDEIKELRLYFERYNIKHDVALFDIDDAIGDVVKADQIVFDILSNVESLRPDQFEKLSARIMGYLGFTTGFTGTKKSWDEGIDFFAYRTSDRYKGDNHREIVFGQCKRKLRTNVVGVGEIRELAGAVELFKKGEFASTNSTTSYKAIGEKVKSFTPLNVFFMTSGFYNSGAKQLCDRSNIIPINLIDLVYMIYRGIDSGDLDWRTNGFFDPAKFLNDINAVKVMT